ncbi:MAG: OB-fold putative lipoprotein [Planctomycetes bacterium]|nr:OB-fold putative lipoprotein [Planctomycetota bacterium]
MRALLLIVAAVMGCGKTKPSLPLVSGETGLAIPPTKSETTSLPKVSPKSPEAARPPLTFAVKLNEFVDDYKNVVAGDLKWKGKRGTVPAGVSDLGRKANGELWISQEWIIGQAHNVYFYLAPGQESEFAKLKIGDAVALEATCDGREDDGINRRILGYNFRVNFVDCVIRPKK